MKELSRFCVLPWRLAVAKLLIIPSLLFLTAAAQLARGQTISHGPNLLGLDIENVTVSPKDSTVQIVFRNLSGRPITAYAVSVASGYSDGEQLSYGASIDFFESLGLERLESSSQPLGAMQSGTARTSSFLYRQPSGAGATLTSLRVSVTGIIFSDESTAGQSDPLAPIFSKRDAESSELLRWCADVGQISGKPVTRKAFTDFVDAHMAGTPQEAQSPISQNSTAAFTRKALVSLLQQGIVWGDDGTGLLRRGTSAMLDAKCSAAAEHVGRNEAK